MRSNRLPPAARPPRRGAILLVVLAMLALFAVLGLSFVLYAESSATAARINREAMDLNSTGGAATAGLGGQEFADAAGRAVGQMLFDSSDTDPNGATSGLRGYGLVRLKYGQDRHATATPYDPTKVSNFGMSPFVGQGLIIDGDPADTGIDMMTGKPIPLTLPTTTTAGGTMSVLRSGVVNYAWQPGEKHILDPEWTKFRTNPRLSTAPATYNPTTAADVADAANFRDPDGSMNPTRAYRNIAAAYTYPDMKDLPLAVLGAVKATVTIPTTPNATTRDYDIGNVLQPSYFRYGPVGASPTPTNMPAWVFNPGQIDPLLRLGSPSLVSGNADWYSPEGRLKLIRPRPYDHLTQAELASISWATPPANPSAAQLKALQDKIDAVGGFPYVPMNPDGTYTGDVLNLPSSGMQRNDSVWVYPAGPIVTVNNKKYTALVAPLVLDLGGRVNLSTAGNLLKNSTPDPDMTATERRRTGDDHASHLGIGRWEVNPRWVFDPNASFRNVGGVTGLNPGLSGDAALNFEPSTTPGTIAHNKLALRDLLTGINGTNGTVQFTQVDGQKVSVPGRYGLRPGAVVSAMDAIGAAVPPTDPVVGLMTSHSGTPASRDAQSYAAFNGTLTNTPTATNIAGDAFRPTDTLRIPPHYSRVNFDAIFADSTTEVVRPAGDIYSPFPVFNPARYYDAATQQFEFNNHPAQFNPSFYPTTGSAGRIFAAADMRWLATRISGRPDEYSNADVAKLLAQELIAGGIQAAPTAGGSPATPRYDAAKPPTAPQTFTATGVPNGTYNPNPYGRTTATDATMPPMGSTDPLWLAKTDPAILTRMLVTTIGNSTSRPELTVKAGPSGATVFPVTGLAQLGPLDMTRPLPDYRYNLPTAPPLTAADWSPLKVFVPGGADESSQRTQIQLAQAARQRFARDIFVRLVALYSKWQFGIGQPELLDGTNVWYVDGDATVPSANGHLKISSAIAPGSDAFNTLRQLAQVAVNLVDYIDPDDISTPFVWNLTAAGDPTATFALAGTGLQGVTGTAIGQSLVFGTELPRLVLSEAYASLENDPADVGGPKATMPYQTRFWVELLNPLGAADPNLSGNGAAQLAYKVGQSPGAAGQPADITPYQFMIVEEAVAAPVMTSLRAADNVLGDLPTGTKLVSQIGRVGPSDYDTGTVNPALTALAGDNPRIVKPAANSAGTQSLKNEGYYVVGPDDAFPTADFLSNGASLKFATPGTVVSTPTPATPGMKVKAAGPTNTNLSDALAKQYTFVLRRLANPYMPEQSNPTTAFYNPYITVDVFDGIVPKDRVKYEEMAMHTPATMPPNATNDPSRGRQHAYGYLTAVNQTLNADPKHSFFQANNTGSTTKLNWLTHLDRQPINALELASVSAVPPSLLTHRFFTNDGSTQFYNGHTAERLFVPGVVGGTRKFGAPFPQDPSVPPAATDLAGGELHQALDYLAVRTPVSATAVGAPEAGRMNLNSVNHPALLRALFDPNSPADPTAANLFEEQDVDSALLAAPTVPGFWQKLVGKPTDPLPVAVPRSPSFPNLSQDVNQPDAPIRAMSGLWVQTTPLPNQLQQTMFRRQNLSVSTDPTLFQNPLQNQTMTGGSVPQAAKDHVSLLTEPLQKVWNNASATSDTFLVVMTVAFFEVRSQDASGRVYLGKELHKDSPGDMRQKFAAVVDRSEAAVELKFTAGNPERTLSQDPARPWYTALTSDIEPGSYDLMASNGPLSVPPLAATDTRYTTPYNPTMNPLTCVIEAKSSSLPYMMGTTPTAVVFAHGSEIHLVSTSTPVAQAVAQNSSTLRIGFGDAILNGGEGEAFDIIGVAPTATPGRMQLTLQPVGLASTGPTVKAVRYHRAGSVVTNVLLGNPGPQPGFTPDPVGRYKSVVRYFGKMNQ